MSILVATMNDRAVDLGKLQHAAETARRKWIKAKQDYTIAQKRLDSARIDMGRTHEALAEAARVVLNGGTS